MKLVAIKNTAIVIICGNSLLHYDVFFQPMLLHVRLHPLLVTATKDKELMRERSVAAYFLLNSLHHDLKLYKKYFFSLLPRIVT